MRHCLWALVLGSAACGGDSIVLTSDLSDLEADGMTVVTLTAEIEFRGGALPDGKDVIFSTDELLLFEDLEDTEADVEDGRSVGESEVKVDSQGGAARAYLLAPTEEMTLTVTASHTTVNKDVLAADLVFDVAPPPLIANGILTDELDTTPESMFTFNCERKNVGAFVEGRPEIRVACYAEVKDMNGRRLPHTPVELKAEAGQVVVTEATEDDPRRITYLVPPTLTNYPRDVSALLESTNRGLAQFGAGLIPGAEMQNPMDGLVSILACVKGHEAFYDANGNGAYDDGEYHIDDGEPFLDVDDDGIYAPGLDEQFCDSNDNGLVDGPNGVFDQDVWIGRMTHVLWSGPIDTSVEHTGISPQNTTIAYQDEVQFVLRAVDANFNPVAVFDDSDEIQFDLDDSHVEFFPPIDIDVPLTNTHGFVIDRTYPSFDWWQDLDRTPALALNGTYLASREFPFVVQDDRSTTSSSIENSYPFTVTAEVRHTPGPGSGFERLTTVLNSSGCLQSQAGDPCP